jgi:hypothetical protein
LRGIIKVPPNRLYARFVQRATNATPLECLPRYPAALVNISLMKDRHHVLSAHRVKFAILIQQSTPKTAALELILKARATPLLVIVCPAPKVTIVLKLQ